MQKMVMTLNKRGFFNQQNKNFKFNWKRYKFGGKSWQLK
jgi:hypothetical protein